MKRRKSLLFLAIFSAALLISCFGNFAAEVKTYNAIDLISYQDETFIIDTFGKPDKTSFDPLHFDYTYGWGCIDFIEKKEGTFVAGVFINSYYSPINIDGFQVGKSIKTPMNDVKKIATSFSDNKKTKSFVYQIDTLKGSYIFAISYDAKNICKNITGYLLEYYGQWGEGL